MSSPMSPRASFGVAKKNVPRVLFRAQAMHDAIVAHAALFLSPTISMAIFATLIAALAVSQQAARGTKATGSTSLRNSKREALWIAMGTLQSYVQALSSTMSPDAARALIETAGMVVAQVVVHHKDVLQAKLTSTPGLVALIANFTESNFAEMTPLGFLFLLAAIGYAETASAVQAVPKPLRVMEVPKGLMSNQG